MFENCVRSPSESRRMIAKLVLLYMNEADTVVTKLVANDWMDDELCKNIARAYALGIGVLTEEPWGI